MNIIFVSESKGGAEKRVRKVLDRYAARIGSATWVGAFTEEGLEDVRQELRAGASKSTAVACHRVVSRREIRLAWIVGSRKLFNRHGEIRVHETTRGLLYEDREPTAPQRVLGFLAMLAGLLHDLGKANAGFQAKLRKPKPEADAIRHELVSVLMLDCMLGFADLKADAQWLEALAQGGCWAKLKPMKLFDLGKVSAKRNAALVFPDADKTPLLFALCWLLVSHHRLPCHDGHTFTGKHHLQNLDDAVALPKAYATLGKLEAGKVPPWSDDGFRQQVAKLAERLHKLQAEQVGTALPSLDALMLYGRLGFQMADHCVSSADDRVEGVAVEKDTPGLFANTIPNRQKTKLRDFRQGLTEHLTRVGEAAGPTVRLLFGLEKRLPRIALDDLPGKLRTASTDPRFRWQDDAARRVRELPGIAEAGLFAVVMAGTGSGKTIGCPKIIAAASDGLRLVYASALRSLTLQTGTALRDDLGFGKEAMAVMVGSALVKRLYEAEQRQDGDTQEAFDYEQEGIASADFDEAFEMDGGGDFACDPRLDALLKKLFKQRRVHDFLTVPVLSATLDSIMKSADARRGGHVAHALRVLSSDVILDEIDLYGPEDLAAIGRLVFQLGLAGRKLAIASATLPPPVARHLFAAYRQGCAEHAALFGKPLPVYAGWFAEESADHKVLLCESTEMFDATHAAFVQTRLEHLKALPPRRSIRRFAEPQAMSQAALFDAVFEACVELHQAHHCVDPATGKRVSIGAVQWGRVRTCMDFAEQAARRAAGEVAHFLVCHHARFSLAVRNKVERDLDGMLRRKDDPGLPLKHPAIRTALEKTPGQDVMVIVSTTLESTGRDHDFDWGVVEPVSARTVVQFAGRIHRHRGDCSPPLPADNLVVLAYPMRHIERTREDACYFWPGPEETLDGKRYRLASHAAADALPVSVVDAGLSIRDYAPFLPTGEIRRAKQLAALEQWLLEDRLAEGLAGAYLSQPTQRLGSMPSEQYRFRRTARQILYWQDEYGIWRVCWDNMFEASQSLGDRLERIKDLPEERFLLRHGARFSILYAEILDALRENDSQTMRCLLSGIPMDLKSAGTPPKVRFHDLLGLDRCR